MDRVTRGAMVTLLKNEYTMTHDFWSLPECPFTEEFFSAFRALDKTDSHLSALLRADMMKGSYRSLKKTMQEAGTLQDYLDAEANLKKYCGCFMDIIRPAVDMHPNKYASISTLSMVAEMAMPFNQQADMYQELMEENPGHRVFMRMFAQACLNTLVHEGMMYRTIDKRMAEAYYARGVGVMQELQKLEPDDSVLHYLFSKYAMWSGEYDLMCEYLDRAKSLRHEHAKVDTDLEIRLLMNGIYRDDKALIDRQTPIVKGLVNDSSLGNFVETLLLGLIAFSVTGRKNRSVEAQRKVYGRFDSLLDDYWKDPLDMTYEERFAFKNSYKSLNLIFEQLGEDAKAKRAGERYEEVDIFF